MLSLLIQLHQPREIVIRRGLADRRIFRRHDHRKKWRQIRTLKYLTHFDLVRHANQPQIKLPCGGFEKRQHAWKQRQVLNHLAVQIGLRIEHGFSHGIGQRLLRVLKHRTDKRPVVHTESAKIQLLSEINLMALEYLLVGLHLNGFVVDDDAVKVKQDGFEHLVCALKSSISFGRRSLSSTSKRRNTSASESSFFRFTW